LFLTALVYLYLRFFLKELVFSEGGEQKGDIHVNLEDPYEKIGRYKEPPDLLANIFSYYRHAHASWATPSS
jgi:hypothetical protein